uniref:Uncharacterized protein n=1 Tax=Plectus sambesii TaxID=2011161 RepID=A0A914V581_9BILA
MNSTRQRSTTALTTNRTSRERQTRSCGGDCRHRDQADRFHARNTAVNEKSPITSAPVHVSSTRCAVSDGINSQCSTPSNGTGMSRCRPTTIRAQSRPGSDDLTVAHLLACSQSPLSVLSNQSTGVRYSLSTPSPSSSPSPPSPLPSPFSRPFDVRNYRRFSSSDAAVSADTRKPRRNTPSKQRSRMKQLKRRRSPPLRKKRKHGVLHEEYAAPQSSDQERPKMSFKQTRTCGQKVSHPGPLGYSPLARRSKYHDALQMSLLARPNAKPPSTIGCKQAQQTGSKGLLVRSPLVISGVWRHEIRSEEREARP